MKSNLFLCGILLLLATAVQLPAQQTEADRKLFEDIKAKADNGDAEAQSIIGGCYQFGSLGTPQDPAEAIKWHRKAAEQGHALSQFQLGQNYAEGYGVKKDAEESVRWYRKAAEQGHQLSQAALGADYYFGLGVDKDFTKALEWNRKAAEQGNAAGQWALGDAYENGNGVTQDFAESIQWYRKSAAQGFSLAQFSLGLFFATGNGVPKDYVEAYKWWNLASVDGNATTKENLAKLERKMTAMQVAEAQQLAREFKSQKKSRANNSISPINPTASGTGFFITDDGYLISNYHVVKGATKVRLVTGAGLIVATVVKVDAANDLALLKVNLPVPPSGFVLDHGFSSLPIAASRTMKLGGTVATVGFPSIGLQGFSPKLAKGEIASLAGAADDPRYFQISVPVQPGNSGGALVDARGNVVGIVAAKLDASAALAATGSVPENVNYAVKSSLLLSFLESVPDVSAKLKEPLMADRNFVDVVKSAQDAAVLVLVY